MLATFYCRVLAGLSLFCLSGAILGCTHNARLSQTDSLSAGLNCVNDSAYCLSKRRQALDVIVADPTNKWIEKPATANADASGIRLFAFKMKKKKLTCGQLRLGYAEASGARSRLKAAKNQKLTPALVSRGAMFGDEVARELKREMRTRRCKPGFG